MANKRINIDDILRHQITLARMETSGYRAHIVPSLAKALRDIRRLLNETGDITSQRQLRSVEAAIRRVIREQEGWAALNDNLEDLADYDNRFYAGLLAVTAADREKVEQLARNTMMTLRSGERFNSGLWPDFVKQNIDYQDKVLSNTLRTAYAEGWSLAEMKRQIGKRFDSDVAKNAETLARTATAHYSMMGKRALAAANPDVITREIPIVTFDNRLSDTCASVGARYGQKGWPVGDSPIGYPPYHFNCRTVVVPMPDGAELVGTRSSRGASGKSKQISAKTPIDDFVRSQPDDWQDDLLGPERAQLFREGKISLSSLTDASLQPLTIPEIAAREGIDWP